MTAEQIKGIINLLPDILIYIVPGSVFIYIFSFISSKERDSETEYFIFKSVVASFLLISSVNLFGKLFVLLNLKINISPFQKSLITIIISILLAYLLGKCYISERINRFLYKIGIYRSTRNRVWDDIADFKEGMRIMVYIPGEKIIYEGKLRKYEENNENYFIFLSHYTSYYYEEDYSSYKVINDYHKNNENWVSINITDISRIELFYNANSSKIK